jgi:GNAT superfamily N-acetyltransferase
MADNTNVVWSPQSLEAYGRDPSNDDWLRSAALKLSDALTVTQPNTQPLNVEMVDDPLRAVTAAGEIGLAGLKSGANMIGRGLHGLTQLGSLDTESPEQVAGQPIFPHPMQGASPEAKLAVLKAADMMGRSGVTQPAINLTGLGYDTLRNIAGMTGQYGSGHIAPGALAYATATLDPWGIPRGLSTMMREGLRDASFSDLGAAVSPEARAGLAQDAVGDHGVSMTLHHYSPTAGLTESDPSFYSNGLKGAEAARVRDYNAPPRTYFYTDPAAKEPGVGGNHYTAEVDGLYPAEEDPLALFDAAKADNTEPADAQINAGITDNNAALSQYEHAVKQAGFTGMVFPSARAAQVFHPVKLSAESAPQEAAPTLQHIVDPDDYNGGSHTFQFPGGKIIANERPGGLQVGFAGVADNMRGKGYGVQLLQAMTDHAHSLGVPLLSDTQVSDAQARVYEALARRGYDVRKNPEVDPGFGGLHSGNGQPVYTIQPPPRPQVPAEDAPPLAEFAEGGSVGSVVGDVLGALVKDAGESEAARASPVTANAASDLSDRMSSQGGFSWNPTTGANAEGPGYMVGLGKSRESVYDDLPTGSDFRAYFDKHKDLFDSDPDLYIGGWARDDGKYVLDTSKKFTDLPVASVAARANKQDAIYSLHDGRALGPEEWAIDQPESTPALERTPANLKRTHYPGVYKPTADIISEAAAQAAPENPLLEQLFGVTRADLDYLTRQRAGVSNVSPVFESPLTLRGKPIKVPQHIVDVTAPGNTQRIQDILYHAAQTPELQGSYGWYYSDPLYQHFVSEWGPDEGRRRFDMLTQFGAALSPQSEVSKEIQRASLANTMANQGRLEDFLNPSNLPEGYGSIAHTTSHADAIRRMIAGQSFVNPEAGTSPKTLAYYYARGVPETQFQTNTPTMDSHWTRAVGLPDVRPASGLNQQTTSILPREATVLAPWWRQLAGTVGQEASPAQALFWNAMGPQTGVSTALSAPYLELVARAAEQRGAQLGQKPVDVLHAVIRGEQHFDDGGQVPESGEVVVTPAPGTETTPERADGTKDVLINGRRMTVSADPDVQARALKAMQYLDAQDKANAKRRVLGLGITAQAYARLGPH